MEKKRVSRRQFLGTAAGVIAAPYFIPSTVLGKDGGVAPSNRLAVAHIGVGGQGSYHLNIHSKRKDVQVVAVCDADTTHMERAKATLKDAYNSVDNIAFVQDFRQLFADHKDKFDVVLIATPDHVHAVNTLAALRAGKDVYCEKPLTRTIQEGRAVADTVKQYGRILQTGSHERSNPKSRYVADLIQNGYLGRISHIDITMPVTNHAPIPAQPPIDPPKELDYDLWLGPAPYVPYFRSKVEVNGKTTEYQRCHFYFRYNHDYATGEMSDRGAHIIDLCHMILGKDDTGPVEVEASGVQHQDGEFDSFMEFTYKLRYEDGVEIRGTSEGTDATRGLKIHGEKGWINVHVHGCALTASDPNLLKIKLKPSDKTVGRVVSHHDSFYDAVRTRGKVTAPAEVGHRSASACHITTTAMLLNRPVKWDPKAERFLDDEEANRYLGYTYRSPWVL